MAPFVEVSACEQPMSGSRRAGTTNVKLTIEQIGSAYEAVDAAHVDDGATARHMRDRMLGHVKVLHKFEHSLESWVRHII